jgi:hypothetical protein
LPLQSKRKPNQVIGKVMKLRSFIKPKKRKIGPTGYSAYCFTPGHGPKRNA